jgi:hypothetical protein
MMGKRSPSSPTTVRIMPPMMRMVALIIYLIFRFHHRDEIARAGVPKVRYIRIAYILK